MKHTQENEQRIGLLGLFWQAFMDGVTLAQPRKWIREAITHEEEEKKAKELHEREEEKRRREEERNRRVAIDNFNDSCKRFGWWMVIILVAVFVFLTWVKMQVGNAHPYIQDLLTIGKWIFGVGISSYAILSMIILREHYFKKWTRKHRELFIPPNKPSFKHVWFFWKYIIGDLMFYGIFAKARNVFNARYKPRKQTTVKE